MGKTAIVWDESFLRHDTGMGHPERPDRLRSILKILKKKDSELDKLKPVEASAEMILRIHGQEHFEKIQGTSLRTSSLLDGDTVASRDSFQAAIYAAGSVVDCAKRVLEGQYDHAFAFVRPPGHHAEKDRAMGFCLFNNVAIAAEELIKKEGLKRVAIIDFDVHHGNGTQHSFEERADVFYVSTHQYPFYPGTGSSEEIGIGVGKGYTLNCPMAAGSGDSEYQQVFEQKIFPALRKYRPEFILVSAGFDAHYLDPLANIELTAQGFKSIAHTICNLSQEVCYGRQVYVLEGGYSLEGLKEGVEEVLGVLT